MSGRFMAVFVALACGPAGLAETAPPPSVPAEVEAAIEALHATSSDGAVVVSYRVRSGLNPEALERLHSGVPVSIRHRVELLGRRPFPLAPRRVVARATVDLAAEYDSLTKRYVLRRSIEFRYHRGVETAAPEPLTETGEAETLDSVRRWMTEIASLRLPRLASAAEAIEGDVRVEAQVGRRFVLFLFPDRITVTAQARVRP